MVSIVVPVFNGEKTIADSLMSLLNQTSPNTELVVVNDGSTDATSAILKEMSDKYPLRVLNIDHKGRSFARNIGTAQARGTIVAFGEADGKADAAWIANAISHLGSGSVAGVVGPRYCWMTDTLVSRCIELELRIRYNDPLFSPVAGWMYRKRVLVEVGGFDERLNVAEDRDLGMRIKKKGYTIAFEPNSVMWHIEPRSLTELLKKTYMRSRDRGHFYLKYPSEYPFVKVSLFLLYIALIVFSMSMSLPLLPMLVGLIPILLVGQFVRLFIKAKRSRMSFSTKYVALLATLSMIRNVLLILGSLSSLKIYLSSKLRR